MEPDLSYVEFPIKILDRKERRTRRQVVKMFKIQWSHHTEDEATWETEEYLNKNFRGFLFEQGGTCIATLVFPQPNLRMRFFLRGVGCDNPRSQKITI